MSILTVATVLASFVRQSAALTRPKTGPKLALKLRGGGASHLSDVAIYGIPALDRADAFGLAMGALAATTVRFVLADPEALGFKNIQPVAVAAFPAALAAAALA